MRRYLLLGACLGWISLVGALPAAAQGAQDSSEDRVGDAFVFGVTTMEYTTGAVLYGLLSRGKNPPPWLHVTLTLTPLAAGVGVGIAAYRGRWNGDVGRAAHGVLWGGLDGLVLGGLLDGYLRDDGFAMGQWAYTFGITGAVIAAWAGASRVDRGEETARWMAAPVTGAMGALLVGGVIAVAASHGGNERVGLRIVGLLAATAVTTGLLLGSLGSSSSEPALEPAENASSGTETDPRRVMISVPFTF